MTWLDRIRDSAVTARIRERLAGGADLVITGGSGSTVTMLVASLAETTHPLLYVVAHLDEADDARDELEACGVTTAKLPALEVMPGESTPASDLLAERLRIVRQMYDGATPQVTVAPIAALMQAVPTRAALDMLVRIVRTGEALNVTAFVEWLVGVGYTRVQNIESAGEFAVRGGIIDLFPPGAAPCRLDLFGDEVERMHEIDLATMGSDRRIESLEVIGLGGAVLPQDDQASFVETMPSTTCTFLGDPGELTEQGRSYFDRVADAGGIFGPPAVFSAIRTRCHAVAECHLYEAATTTDAVFELPVRPLPIFAETASDAVEELAEMALTSRVIVCVQNEGERDRMRELVDEFAADVGIEIDIRYVHRGFIWVTDADGAMQAIVPYHELLHRYHARRRVRRIAGSKALDSFVDLEPGDFVVHRDHGIARFIGLRTIESNRDQPPEEYLTLEFAKEAKLNVPVAQIDLVQKYIGAFHGRPELSTLGGKRWKHQKEKVADAVRDLAAEMLRMQAVRESTPGIRYPSDTAWQREFEAEFPYEETEDQLAAITAIKKDMSGPRPMDRLVCGDVGFGKTEVAIRAAFKAVEFGKQVAVLVPTTVLAEQHERTFRERFADYPFAIASLSRFKSTKDQKVILGGVKKGEIDIIVGTHRLLSKDMRFSDLGLVIIDEEQRFGVEHKQRLLEFRTTADVLTLSATPIPRTLHMALLGLRDISSLTTAPLDRRAIVTEVLSYNAQRVKQAIARELAREGQIFFVHNRVHDIQSVADDVQKLAPDACILVGHGQMPPRELEKVMLQFIRGDADILVSTTIIESGIDIPRANTMFIHEAHMFGLSELHQLRGRVGRYKHRAYCYLLLSPGKRVSDVAMKRLRALESFSMLGAGFRIALRDLELRGAGNLLGAEQSGHIAAVGYEMYCQLLEHAVSSMRNEEIVSVIDTTIDLPITGLVPRGYVPADGRRMDAYRRISRASDEETLVTIENDLVSAYGPVPKSTRKLLDLARLRIAAAHQGIRSIRLHERDVIFRTADPGALDRCMKGVKGTVRLVGDPTEEGLAEVYFRPPKSFLEPSTLLVVLLRRLTTPTEASPAATAGVR